MKRRRFWTVLLFIAFLAAPGATARTPAPAGAPGAGAPPEPSEPWLAAARHIAARPQHVVRSAHALFFAVGRFPKGYVERLDADFERRIFPRVTELLGRTPVLPVTVRLYDSRDALRDGLLQEGISVDEVDDEIFAVQGETIGGTIHILADDPSYDLSGVLAHELAHTVLASLDIPDMSAWLNEAVATEVEMRVHDGAADTPGGRAFLEAERDDVLSAAHRGGFRRLPLDAAAYYGLLSSYPVEQQSHLIFQIFLQRYGWDGLEKLLRAQEEGYVDTATAFPAVFGLSEEAFVRAAEDELRRGLHLR
ncbi:MAG: hypothetical protein IMW98_07320 [Firmicutes bacterium]|nr:hypothetical protein [Bacillota bacterium]